MKFDIEEIQGAGELSGSGMFSSVYVMPGGKAIKTSNHANSDGWLWWAIIAMNNPDNPYTPNIESIHIDVFNNTFVAVMEALETDAGALGRISDEAYEAGNGLFDACREICPFILYLDICDGHTNWMQGYDLQEVWTDPFCYEGWRYIKPQLEERTRINALQEYLYHNPVEGITFAHDPSTTD